jgi:hypothetical protein
MYHLQIRAPQQNVGDQGSHRCCAASKCHHWLGREIKLAGTAAAVQQACSWVTAAKNAQQTVSQCRAWVQQQRAQRHLPCGLAAGEQCVTCPALCLKPMHRLPSLALEPAAGAMWRLTHCCAVCSHLASANMAMRSLVTTARCSALTTWACWRQSFREPSGNYQLFDVSDRQKLALITCSKQAM